MLKNTFKVTPPESIIDMITHSRQTDVVQCSELEVWLDDAILTDEFGDDWQIASWELSDESIVINLSDLIAKWEDDILYDYDIPSITDCSDSDLVDFARAMLPQDGTMHSDIGIHVFPVSTPTGPRFIVAVLEFFQIHITNHWTRSCSSIDDAVNAAKQSHWFSVSNLPGITSKEILSSAKDNLLSSR
jgi:hypothetical protein